MDSKDSVAAPFSLRPLSLVDTGSLVPADSLSGDVHPTCVAYHPVKPLLAVAAGSLVAVRDLQLGCWQGQVELRAAPVALAFAHDSTQLIAVTQDWNVLAVNVTHAGGKSRVVCPRTDKVDRPLAACLLAVSRAPVPLAFFCPPGKDALRMAPINAPPSRDAKGKERRERPAKWGAKLKMGDSKKAILAVEAHPSDAQVLTLTADGVLRSYTISSAGLTLLYAVPVPELGPRESPDAYTLQCLPHPLLPAGAVVTLFNGAESGLLVMETYARGEPRLVLRTRAEEWARVCGVGVQREALALVAFGAARGGGGGLRAAAWHVLGRPNAPGLTLSAAGLEPADVASLLQPPGGGSGGVAMPSADGSLQPLSLQSLWSGQLGDAFAPAAASSAKQQQQLKPAAVLMHPSNGLVAVRYAPAVAAGSPESSQLLSRLPAAEASRARAATALQLLQLSSHWQPFHGSPAHVVAPLHTPISCWQSDKVVLPPHVYYASNGRVHKYAVATHRSGPVAELTADTSADRVLRHVCHSARHSCWLLFSQAAAHTADDEALWTWTLASHGGSSSSGSGSGGSAADGGARWQLPGKYGAFVGPDELHFVIARHDGASLAVYSTLTQHSARSQPLLTVTLASPASGALFPGPPCLTAPTGGATPGGVADVLDVVGGFGGSSGSGVVVWEAPGGWLCLGTLPSPPAAAAAAAAAAPQSPSAIDTAGASPKAPPTPTGLSALHAAADDDATDSLGPNASPKAAPAVAPAPATATMSSQCKLQLQPGEVVLQVAWQRLGAAGQVVVSPNDAACAVLTNQRVVIAKADLTPVAAASLSSTAKAGGVGGHPSSSVLWVGPSLLYLTAAGHVCHVSWTGAVSHVCSVAPQPAPALLVGATADVLLVLRPAGLSSGPAGSSTSAWEVSQRPANLLQPLLLGHASLAAVALQPNALLAARLACQQLCAHSDVSAVDDRAVAQLIDYGFPDVAHALAQHLQTSLLPHTRLAACAAAGKWPQAVAALRAEYERSVYPPRPPAPSSALHLKLVAAAAGAVDHGQFATACELLKLAGAWQLALGVAAVNGDATMVSSIEAALQAQGRLGGLEAEVAQVLRLKLQQQGASGAVRDLALQLVTADGRFQDDAAAWALGKHGARLKCETAAGATAAALADAAEVGAVAAAGPLTLVSCQAAATAQKGGAAGAPPAALFRTTSQAGGGSMRSSMQLESPSASLGGGSGHYRQRSSSDFQFDSQQLHASTAGSSSGRGDDGIDDSMSMSSDEGSRASPAGARPAGVSGGGRLKPPAAAADDDDFYSSDEDGVAVGPGTRGGGIKRFTIQIKAKEDVTTSMADSEALKAAASKLRLSTLEPPARSPGPSGGGGGGSSGGGGLAASGSFGKGAFAGLSGKLGGGGGSGSGAGGALPPLSPPPPSTQGGGGAHRRVNSMSSTTSSTTTDEHVSTSSSPRVTSSSQPSPPPPRLGGATSAALSGGFSSGGGLQPPPLALKPPPSQPPLGALGGGSGKTSAALSGGKSLMSFSPVAAQAGVIASSGGGFKPSRPAPTLAAPLDPTAFGDAPAATAPVTQPAAGGAAGAFGAQQRQQQQRQQQQRQQQQRQQQQPVASASASSSSSIDLYKGGVAAMVRGDWDESLRCFATALDRLAAETGGQAQQQRSAFCANYYALVRIVSRAAAGSGPLEAKLYRFASALRVDDSHMFATVRESVKRNKAAGNYRYCADKLTWLITKGLGVIPMETMAKFQEEIDECDRRGSNSSLPADENIDDFVDIVSAARSAADLEDVLGPLLSGGL